MKFMPASAAMLIFSITAFAPFSRTGRENSIVSTSMTSPLPRQPKIQAAILLDVSNSMDGLIDQAKAQLWNMVSVMGRVKCENGNPKIEIALYEYGRDDNDPKKGYIKQITGFISDLDHLSQELFKLTTYGGSEYCGHVIHTSLDELSWDTASSGYKVIFIAGNEDFLQGDIQYTQACAEAKKKGVIVNTIYCGSRAQGIREHWNLGAECGNGSFTNIDHNAKVQDIPTPYDSTLVRLNNKLNGTYLYYGREGSMNFKKQEEVDKMNMGYSNSVAAKRVAVKGQRQLYNNAAWDMVDAYAADSTRFIQKVDRNTLPDSLKNKSLKELEKAVKEKSAERSAIQKDILHINTQRENYIASEKAKTAKNNAPTLETEVEKAIREQVKRFNMYVE